MFCRKINLGQCYTYFIVQRFCKIFSRALCFCIMLFALTDFSDQFRKIIMRYKRIGYTLNVMRQSACLVINPITVDNYAALFNWRLNDGPDLKLFILVGWDRSFRLLLGPPGLN